MKAIMDTTYISPPDITAPVSSPVTFEFVTESTPIDLVHQYFQLRQDVFTNYWHLKQFAGDEDEYDKMSVILLMCHQNTCVGGARIVIRPAYSDIYLPMETADFLVTRLLPDLHLEGKNYVEICRLAILPEFMNGSHSTELYYQLACKCKELNISYAFGVSPILQARKIRIACRSFGMDTKICNDIAIPPLATYEGITMRLTVMDVASWNNHIVESLKQTALNQNTPPNLVLKQEEGSTEPTVST